MSYVIRQGAQYMVRMPYQISNRGGPQWQYYPSLLLKRRSIQGDSSAIKGNLMCESCRNPIAPAHICRKYAWTDVSSKFINHFNGHRKRGTWMDNFDQPRGYEGKTLSLFTKTYEKLCLGHYCQWWCLFLSTIQLWRICFGPDVLDANRRAYETRNWRSWWYCLGYRFWWNCVRIFRWWGRRDIWRTWIFRRRNLWTRGFKRSFYLWESKMESLWKVYWQVILLKYSLITNNILSNLLNFAIIWYEGVISFGCLFHILSKQQNCYYRISLLNEKAETFFSHTEKVLSVCERNVSAFSFNSETKLFKQTNFGIFTSTIPLYYFI